jgi:hypothetical protein
VVFRVSADVAAKGAGSQCGKAILEEDDVAIRIRCFSRVNARQPEGNQDKS